MNYQKEFKRHGEIHSVSMSEEDIVSVLDQLIEFYGEHGCYGEEIQQNSRCHHKLIDLVSKMCDFDFRIM